jgi:hypothetical protein
MIKPDAFLLVTGDEFSPSKAEALLNLDFGSTKNEPGDLGVKGKYKDRPKPYGSATINYSWLDCSAGLEMGIPDLLPPNLDLFLIPNFIGTLRNCGGTDITLYINVGYDSQCNMELSLNY